MDHVELVANKMTCTVSDDTGSVRVIKWLNGEIMASVGGSIRESESDSNT